MSNYKAVGNWRVENRLTADDGTEILTEVSDVRESNGNIWHDGAHRVSVNGPGKPAGFRRKNFIGETAWMDAERLANDLFFQIRLSA